MVGVFGNLKWKRYLCGNQFHWKKQTRSRRIYDKRFCLLEDNEDLCRYLMNAFQTDYRVVIAKNGKVGLEKALEILPDVIVSDVMMPVMNGIECCEALKTDERTAHIPVILLTALAEERQQLEG